MKTRKVPPRAVQADGSVTVSLPIASSPSFLDKLILVVFPQMG
jgi:hypothetical protein